MVDSNKIESYNLDYSIQVSFDIVETLMSMKLISCTNIPEANKRMLDIMLSRS